MAFRPSRYLPILEWGRDYRRETLVNDLIAAVIVTIMLIPQSLAYAMLAGLPPVIGLYASILPLIAYALFGTSRTLAVGPVAILSLMTAAAAGKVAAQGSEAYIQAALILAFLSGVILLVLGLFRMGFLANFLSHPVVSGFITASGIIIAASQLKHILGYSIPHTETLIHTVEGVVHGAVVGDVDGARIGRAAFRGDCFGGVRRCITVDVQAAHGSPLLTTAPSDGLADTRPGSDDGRHASP